MSTTNKANSENTKENPSGNNKSQGKKPEEKEENKDWSEIISAIIKNPIATGITGLAAGYLIGTYKANKEKEALIEEHKQQLQEQGLLFTKAIEAFNENIKQLNGLPKGKSKRTLELEEGEDKTYHYATKSKHFKL